MKHRNAEELIFLQDRDYNWEKEAEDKWQKMWKYLAWILWIDCCVVLVLGLVFTTR